MKIKMPREKSLLALLFLAVLGIRLFLAFQAQGLDYDAYYALRQAEHIKQAGTPLFNDPLSYSGRNFVTPPLFYYLLAGFSLIMPLELAAKILPNILFSALAIVIYLIVKHITKNKTAAFISSLFSAASPILFETISQVSVYSLSLFLIFLLSYSFLRLEEKGFIALSISSAILLLLTHASVFILLVSFFIYFIILRLEKQEISKKELETAVFLFFLTLWFNILLYKKAFSMHGIIFIWQNIPAPLLSSYFQDISFFGVIYAVGIIPLLLGVYAIYHVSFKARSRAAVVFISFALTSFIILWLKLLPFKKGLLFLSLNLAILSGVSIKSITLSLAKTKLSRFNWAFPAAIIILFTIATLPLLFIQQEIPSPPTEDIEALEWVASNTGKQSVVLGDVKEGFLINYVAQRKNVADSNFLFIKEINQRYDDINRIFNTRLKSEALRLLNKYDVDYIYLSSKSMAERNMTELFYAEKDCFELVYDKGAKVYELLSCDV